jgi:hypothetical protein
MAPERAHCPGCRAIVDSYTAEPETIVIPDGACDRSKVGLEWMRESKAGTLKAWELEREAYWAALDSEKAPPRTP